MLRSYYVKQRDSTDFILIFNNQIAYLIVSVKSKIRLIL